MVSNRFTLPGLFIKKMEKICEHPESLDNRIKDGNDHIMKLWESLAENEKKDICIVETRGISTAKETEAVDDILQFVSAEIKYHLGDGDGNSNKVVSQINCNGIVIPCEISEFTIEVSPSISRRITFLSDSKFIFNVKNYDVDGKNEYLFYHEFGNAVGGNIGGTLRICNNGNLSGLILTIDTYSVNKKLLTVSTKSVFYHELNHAFELWNRLKNCPLKGADRTLKVHDENLYAIIKDWLKDDSDEDKQMLAFALYGLYFKTEMNAIVKTVFPELEKMKVDYRTDGQQYGSIKNHYMEDIQRLSAYKLYKGLSLIVEDLKKCPVEKWNMWNDLLRIKSSGEAFRKWFFWLMDIRLNDFFHRIGRASSYYYDSTEKFEKNLLTLS